jgi:methylenetetrahydrofolate reductase (NADPH)
MLCLSGDHQKFGNHPESKNVFDLDSMQLVNMVKKMRDEGKFLNRRGDRHAPKLFHRRRRNPFADPFDFRSYRLATKIDAGADFIQTQCIYNMPRFREFMKRAWTWALPRNAYILAGVTPMKSAGMAKYMAKSVPGMDVPE